MRKEEGEGRRRCRALWLCGGSARGEEPSPRCDDPLPHLDTSHAHSPPTPPHPPMLLSRPLPSPLSCCGPSGRRWQGWNCGAAAPRRRDTGGAGRGRSGLAHCPKRRNSRDAGQGPGGGRPQESLARPLSCSCSRTAARRIRGQRGSAGPGTKGLDSPGDTQTLPLAQSQREPAPAPRPGSSAAGHFSPLRSLPHSLALNRGAQRGVGRDRATSPPSTLSEFTMAPTL